MHQIAAKKCAVVGTKYNSVVSRPAQPRLRAVSRPAARLTKLLDQLLPTQTIPGLARRAAGGGALGGQALLRLQGLQTVAGTSNCFASSVCGQFFNTPFTRLDTLGVKMFVLIKVQQYQGSRDSLSSSGRWSMVYHRVCVCLSSSGRWSMLYHRVCVCLSSSGRWSMVYHHHHHHQRWSILISLVLAS